VRAVMAAALARARVQANGGSVSVDEQLLEHTQKLNEAQQKVDQLVGAQKRLHGILGGQMQRKSAESIDPKQDSVGSRLGRAMAKIAELRELLGITTRRQNESFAETAALREQLRLERDQHSALRAVHTTQSAELETSRKSEAELSAQLAGLQTSSSERITKLEQEIADLHAAEKRRLELEAAFEAAAAAPPMPTPSIAVQKAPPPVQPSGFSAASGGFSL